MTMEIKRVLLHFTEEEHNRLKKMKEGLELSWEKFIIYLSHDNKENKENKKR